MRSKIIITGSSGMLGSALCDIFNKGYEVFGLDLKNRNGLNNFFKCNITDFDAVKKYILSISPDIVIHTAAYTDVDGCQSNKAKAESINIKGSINIVRACKLTRCTLFFISTDYIFDGKKKRAYSEIDNAHPLNIYGRTKLAAENFIRDNLTSYFIIRTSWLYGHGGKNFVDTIINKVNTKHSLKVVSDQIGGPTYVYDLAKTVKRLARKLGFNPGKHAGIYNVTNSGKCSWYEFAREIVKISKLKVNIIPVKSMHFYRAAKRPRNSVLNNSKFNRLTHMPMRNWKKALRVYLNTK